jgi:hypothetical protein
VVLPVRKHIRFKRRKGKMIQPRPEKEPLISAQLSLTFEAIQMDR